MPPPHLIIVIKSIISFYHANSSLFSDNLSKFYHTISLREVKKTRPFVSAETALAESADT